MFRAFGMFGLGIAFLIVSPTLRACLIEEIEALGNTLNDYSPASYIGVGMAMLLAAMFWVYRTSQPR